MSEDGRILCPTKRRKGCYTAASSRTRWPIIGSGEVVAGPGLFVPGAVAAAAAATPVGGWGGGGPRFPGRTTQPHEDGVRGCQLTFFPADHWRCVGNVRPHHVGGPSMADRHGSGERMGTGRCGGVGGYFNQWSSGSAISGSEFCGVATVKDHFRHPAHWLPPLPHQANSYPPARLLPGCCSLSCVRPHAPPPVRMLVSSQPSVPPSGLYTCFPTRSASEFCTDGMQSVRQ